MGVATGIVVFLIIWWTVLFAVLPFGADPEENPRTGHSTSAPKRPRLLLKAAVTTGITAMLWVIVYAAIEINVLDFREWANELPTDSMPEGDGGAGSGEEP
jgi:predicted secreted protein